MSGCPLIMNGIGGIMPQESVTVRYGVRHGIARTVRSASQVGEILETWEQNPHELSELKKNLRDRYPARHPQDILERAADCRLGNLRRRISDTHARQGVR